jgi:hypothetical protein
MSNQRPNGRPATVQELKEAIDRIEAAMRQMHIQDPRRPMGEFAIGALKSQLAAAQSTTKSALPSLVEFATEGIAIAQYNKLMERLGVGKKATK